MCGEYQISSDQIVTVIPFGFKYCENCIVDMQVLKDGMQHMGKLICSNLGARMDSEPKRWRILGLYFGSLAFV